jgi:hypothetical protein
MQEKSKIFGSDGDFCVSVVSRLCVGHQSVETRMLYQGGRGYPIHRFPIAMRLRDRKGRAILCIALNPHYGDSSGAILGVRSVALLYGYRSVESWRGGEGDGNE